MTEQIGFSFLEEIDRTIKDREEQKAYERFPSDMPAGLALYREMIDRHHETMLCGDIDGTMAIRKEAHDLAYKLNGFQPGIRGSNDVSGRVLEHETAAEDGRVPKWGQTGRFQIIVGKMRVSIEQHGIFGIGALHMYWPGFAAHAVDLDKPFLSETGYRSFICAGLTLNGQVATGVCPDGCASEMIFQHVSRDLKGKLFRIMPFEERMNPRKQIPQPAA